MEAAIFFWLAGVSDSLCNVLGSIGALAFAAGMVGWEVYATNCGNSTVKPEYKWERDAYIHFYEWKPDKSAIAVREFWNTKISQIGIAIGAVSIALSVLLPSKDTLYLMAGGYFGQNIVMSDTAQKVKDVVDIYLDEQLEKLSKGK